MLIRHFKRNNLNLKLEPGFKGHFTVTRIRKMKTNIHVLWTIVAEQRPPPFGRPNPTVRSLVQNARITRSFYHKVGRKSPIILRLLWNELRAFPRSKWLWREVTTHVHLLPRLEMEGPLLLFHSHSFPTWWATVLPLPFAKTTFLLHGDPVFDLLGEMFKQYLVSLWPWLPFVTRENKEDDKILSKCVQKKSFLNSLFKQITASLRLYQEALSNNYIHFYYHR
jgi:hypothetical protein